MAAIQWMTILLLNSVLSVLGEDDSGPRFRAEPPFRVEFSNSSGAEVRCTAEGNPGPRISWQNREGAAARDIPGIRYTRSDGTLVFPPFSREDYRQEVHDTVYQCVAVNTVGGIVSREVHVRGVVQQTFIPQVYDDYVIRGNTAVLRCHLPSFVREYVTLDSWLIDDDVVIKSTDTQNDKYTVLSSGELLLHKVDDSDGQSSFKCRASHRLTGELVLSPTVGKVIVTEPHSPMGPRVTFSQSQVRAEEGTYVRIPCVATAQPAPEYRWLKETPSGLFPVIEDHRFRVTSGTLHIKNVAISDGGKYQCIISNGIGDKRTDTVLIVTAPLRITLSPPLQTLNIGETAVLNCSVTGHPVHTITWRKDRGHLATDARLQLLARDVLHITAARREDEGMYQCFAYNEADGRQATARIKIGDVPPYLLSAFPDTAAHPGERISLKCVSAGNFAPKVVWTLYGQELKPSTLDPRIQIGDFVSSEGHVTSYLNVTSARVEDGGVYRCDVSNDVGAVAHSARLSVYGPPFVRAFPNVSAVSGQELVLQCPYGGYPIKSITWQKGGIILPLDHRHKISSAGHLTIQDVQKAADEGKYTCTAQNKEGQTASGTTHISVVVAPVIDAQYFPDTITASEGDRAKIICSATTGDPPIRFKWLKNGFRFISTGQVAVQSLEDSSVIMFKKVKASDRGQYTCIASNAATSTNRTSLLVVNVPPSWLSEPVNTSAILGSSAWMNCSAEGFPTPSVIWRKARESSPGDYGYVTSSPRIRQYNNGSLVLWDVELMDKGYYLCQANNGIGAALSKVIYLNVQVPPKFEESYQSRAIKEGDNTSLKCTARGNTPIVITWQKNKTPITTKSRYSFRETSEDNSITSELVIVSATRDESGMYACAAVNDFGYDEATFQLVVQGVPDPPTSLSVTNVTSRTVTLRWEVPFNGNSHVTGSSVQYKMAEDSWKGHTSQLIVSGSDSTAVLRALHPVTTYHIRVIAENAIGKSRPGAIINVTTQVEAPSGPPRELVVHPTGDQSLKVSWKPPRVDARHGRIQGYHVGYRVYHSNEKFQFKPVEANEEGTEQHSTYVTGLLPFTKYEIIVKAYNVAGAGPQTDSIIGTTLETAPPTSPILQVIGSTTNSINIRWEKDSKDRSSITEYTLHYKPDDGMWLSKKLRSTTDKYVLENVKCGTKYHMYLTASNSLGTGEPSRAVTIRTKGAVYTKKLRSTTDKYVLENVKCGTKYHMYLTASNSLGTGEPSRAVTIRTKGAVYTKKLRSTTDKYVLENVKYGTKYHMYLTASNSLGTGEPSRAVTIRTKGAAPMPAPQGAFLTVNSTFVVLHLDGWQSGGCPIQHFTVQYRPKYQSQWISAVPERVPATRDRATVGQLSPDREYVVMVTAHSETGVTQAEYSFRTMPLSYSSDATSLPGLVRRDLDLPFHRNVALVIPVVVSSLVLIIVIFTVVICLRKHTHDRRREQEYDSPKVAADSLLMAEVSQKSLSGKQSVNGSHYSSPARGQHQFAKEQRRSGDKQHEYAEPYTAYPTSRQRSDEGSFATIKRAPPRSGSMTSAYKTGFS